ncbi:MAG: hypothetical protein VX335_01400 [Pseudomonadota bacterium]|nr:hypothetical protein [Pseudomonadota bacterium]
MALDWFKDGKSDAINKGIQSTLQNLSPDERNEYLFSLFKDINEIPEKPYLEGKEGQVTTIQKTALKQNFMYRGFLRKFAKDKTVDLKQWSQEGVLIEKSFDLLKKTIDFSAIEVNIVKYKGHLLKDAFGKGFVKYYLHTVFGQEGYKKLLQEYDQDKKNKKNKKLILLNYAQQQYPDIVKLNQNDLDARSEIIFSSIRSLRNDLACNSSDGYTSRESTESLYSDAGSITGVSSQYGDSDTDEGKSVTSDDSSSSIKSNLTEANLKLHNMNSFKGSKKHNFKDNILKFCSKAKRLVLSSRLAKNRNDISKESNNRKLTRPESIGQESPQDILNRKFMGDENKTGSQK